MTVISLFGAASKIGSRVLTRALDAGLDVRALVREPGNITVSSPRLTVIQGNVLDKAAVDLTVVGSDAVLSLFGQVRGSPHTLQTNGTALIVAAMKRHDVTRIVTLSDGGLSAPLDSPGVSDKIVRCLRKTFSGQVLADAEGHLAVLESSGLDWTVVRGPRLTGRPWRGSCWVGWVGMEASAQIGRDDLAYFILTQINDRTYIGQLPFVSA